MDFVIPLIPSVVSLVSAAAAWYAVWTNRRIATQQAFFAQKAKVYDDFLKAFSAVVYDHTNNGKREALTHAIYSASLYAPEDLISKLNQVVNRVFIAESHREFVDLEAELVAVIDLFAADLRSCGEKSEQQG